MEELVKTLEGLIKEAEKRIEELKDAIRLGELMNIDVSKEKAELQQLSIRLENYKKGIEAYKKYKARA